MSNQLAVGDKAPDFELAAADGTTVSLASLAGKKTVLYFYPAAGTPGCTKQACDFRDSLAALQGHGYAVVGVSPDSVAKLAKFAAKESLTFPLLADPDRNMLAAYGAYGEKSLYGKKYVGVIRSTVVLDENGTVTLAQYNVKATGHVARLRRDLGVDAA